MAAGQPPPQRLFWCLECDRDAVPTCTDQHSICSLKKGLLQKVEAKVADLQKSSGVDVVSKLLQKLAILQQGGGGQLVDAQQAALVEQNRKVQEAIQTLYKAVELPGNNWQAALQSLEAEAKTSSEKLPTWEGALQLLSMEDIMEFSVGNDRAGKWTGKLQFTDAGSLELLNLFRQVLFRLQIGGYLAKSAKGTDDVLKIVPHTIECMSLCDQPYLPYSDEDILDMSLFHDEFGFHSTDHKLQQILEAKKVRRIFGLGSYNKNSPQYSATKELGYNPFQFVWHGISRTLEVHRWSVEEMSLTTPCKDHLRSALEMPSLRKLQISFESSVCDCCRQAHAFAFGPGPALALPPTVPVSRSIQCVDVRVDMCEEWWLSPLLKTCSATLREVIIAEVPLPAFPGTWGSGCKWLPESLKQCQKLQSVTLARPGFCPGGPVCAAQISNLRKVIAKGVTVRCKDCNLLTMK